MNVVLSGYEPIDEITVMESFSLLNIAGIGCTFQIAAQIHTVVSDNGKGPVPIKSSLNVNFWDCLIAAVDFHELMYIFVKLSLNVCGPFCTAPDVVIILPPIGFCMLHIAPWQRMVQTSHTFTATNASNRMAMTH